MSLPATWLRRMKCAVLPLVSVLYICLSATTSTVFARPVTPTQQLAEAVSAYEHGGYLEAAALLSRILYPLKLTEPADIVKARVYLGLCYYVLGQKEDAEQEFRGVFKIDPTYKPDPFYIPEEIISFMEALRPPPPMPPKRLDIDGLGERIEEAPTSFRLAVAPANLLPLGIPQLRNGERGRGVALLVTQTLLLGVNVTSYILLERYNDPMGNSEALHSYLVGAKAINVASFSLLTLTVMYGVGDALVRYPAGNEPDSRLSPRVPHGSTFALGFSRRF